MMEQRSEFSAQLVLMLAVSCGLIVANLYYSQPLLHQISRDLNMNPAAAGLFVTMSQVGYGLGLLFIVPTGDLIENKKLIMSITSIGIAALVWAGLTNNATHFILASLMIGIGSVSVQIIVPYAAHIAPQEIQGRVVGTVVSGLMLGIMFARPVSSFMTEITSSWHTIFLVSACVLTLLLFVIYKRLPERKPPAAVPYGRLILSMKTLFLTTPILRRRAAYQAFMFSAFSLFWTTVPLLLSGSAYNMSQGKIALFGLAGVAGAVSAPIAGRVADKGISKKASAGAMIMAALAFPLTYLADMGSTAEVVLLTMAAIIIDFGVTANLVLGQRAIYSLSAEYRSRLNGIYMSIFFAGGAVGSAVGGYTFALGGWMAASLVGFLLPVCSLLYLLTEPKDLYKKS